MKQNGFAPLIIILVIAILGVVGYMIYKNNSQILKSPNNTPIHTTSSNPAPSDIGGMLVQYFANNDFSSLNSSVQTETYWQLGDKLYLFPDIVFPTTGYDQYNQIVMDLGVKNAKTQLQSLLIQNGFVKNNQNSIPVELDNTILVESSAFEKGDLKCVLDYLSPESDTKKQGAVWLSCGELKSDTTEARFTDTKNISQNPNYELIIDKKSDQYIVYDLIQFDGSRFLARKDSSGNWNTVLSFGQAIPLCSEVDKLNLPYEWQPGCSGGPTGSRHGGLILK